MKVKEISLSPCQAVVSEITGNNQKLTNGWSFWASIKQFFSKIIFPYFTYLFRNSTYMSIQTIGKKSSEI